MVIVEVKTDRTDEYIVYFTLNIEYEKNISRWIDKKISKNKLTVTKTGIDQKQLQEMCLKKFGEAPCVINAADIQTIHADAEIGSLSPEAAW